ATAPARAPWADAPAGRATDPAGDETPTTSPHCGPCAGPALPALPTSPIPPLLLDGPRSDHCPGRGAVRRPAPRGERWSAAAAGAAGPGRSAELLGVYTRRGRPGRRPDSPGRSTGRSSRRATAPAVRGDRPGRPPRCPTPGPWYPPRTRAT